jgi:hypothetical protein
MAFDRGDNQVGVSSVSILPIEQGGTNASTVEGAKTNLGLSGITSVNGNVGIGTSSPAQSLDVNGNIQIRSTNRIGFFDQNYFIRASSGLEVQSLDLIRFLTNGANERMRIDSSGNVGIGTSAIAGKFNVGGGRSTFGANSEVYSIGVGYTQARVNSGQVYYVGATDSATPDLVFSNAAGTERMRIDSSGNVGIGTSSPARPLHVSDVMRLEPRNGAPSSPAKGDIYFDSADDKLKCYDGANWQNLF